MNNPTASPSPIVQLAADDLQTPPLSLRQLTWRRFRRHKMALFGLAMLFVLVAYSYGGMLLVSEEYANHNDTKLRIKPPSNEHLFGTDTVGRDILARTIYGGQISIVIGLTAALLEVLMGVTIGALAGYYGGFLDSLMMRFTEAILNIPQIFLLIVMAKFFGGNLPNVTLMGREYSGSLLVIIAIIGLTSWPYLARIVRSQFLSIKENDFILAARATGTPTWQIIFYHILPNSIAPIVVAATLGVANAITLEAYISFLGLGVKPPTATWGNMLEGAYGYIDQGAYWLWLFPGLLILLTVLSVNFLGDGLRDALDPRSRTV